MPGMTLLVGSDPLELWQWTLAPGEERVSDAHRSNAREVLLVTAGTVTLAVGTADPVVLRRGQSALFRADEPHCYRNDGKTQATFVLAVHEPSGGVAVNARSLSLAVVVAAFTCYHLAQRSMPEGLRPAPLFAFVYGAATVLMTAVVAVGSSTGGLRAVTGTAAHWAPWSLVASITGIELGVYAMYRAGWTIGAANITTQAIVTAILVVVGVVGFGEQLTASKLAGLAMCVIGGSLVVAR